MSRRDPHRDGFTLIELVAAVVILAVAIPPMLWTIKEAHYQRTDPVFASRARWLAVEKLEDIIADRHSSTRGYSYLIAGNYPVENSVTGYTNFKRTVTLTETLADLTSAGAGYMNVDVALEWTDGMGDTQTLTIATVLTDYDP